MYVLPYPLQKNPGVLLIFWIFRPCTLVDFATFLSKNTVIFDEFSPKMTKVRPKYAPWGSIQEGVLLKRIRYPAEIPNTFEVDAFFKISIYPDIKKTQHITNT